MKKINTQKIGSLTLCLLFFFNVIFAQDCDKILQYGIYDYHSTNSANSYSLAFINWYKNLNINTYEQFKNSSFYANVPIKGVVIGAGGANESSQYQQFINYAEQYQNLSVNEKSSFDQRIQTINPQIVAAWEKCIGSLGLHIWIEHTENLYDFVLCATYKPTGLEARFPTLDNISFNGGSVKAYSNVFLSTEGKNLNLRIKDPIYRQVFKRLNNKAFSLTINTIGSGFKYDFREIEVIPPLRPCPPITIQTFTESSGSSTNPSATVTVPAGYKVIGGGAVVNFSAGPGCVLYESYPSSPTTWTASAKDHLDPFKASITTYAIALYDPNNQWDVQIKSSLSGNPVNRSAPVAKAQLDEGYVLTGGGAQARYSGAGHLLFASYPENNTWKAGSRDHGDPSNGFVISYAIGIKPRIPCKQQLKSEIKSFTGNGPTSHPQGTTPEQQNGWFLTGGGTKLNYSGPGQLLTASYPTDDNRWFAKGKDHKFAATGTIDVYAIYIKFE